MLPARYRDALASEVRYLLRRLARPAHVSVAGVRIAMTSPELSPLMRHLLYKGAWEADELRALDGSLRPGDVALDIGAGMGVVTAWACRRVGPAGQVHAFEANPRLMPLLEETMRRNGVSPRLHHAAVTAEGGTTTLMLHPDLYTSSTGRTAGSTDRVEVPARSLASLLAEHRPTYLIVDAEGEERSLFAGTDLSGVRAVCVEIHPDMLDNKACTKVMLDLVAQGFVRDFNLSAGWVHLFVRADG